MALTKHRGRIEGGEKKEKLERQQNNINRRFHSKASEPSTTAPGITAGLITSMSSAPAITTTSATTTTSTTTTATASTIGASTTTSTSTTTIGTSTLDNPPFSTTDGYAIGVMDTAPAIAANYTSRVNAANINAANTFIAHNFEVDNNNSGKHENFLNETHIVSRRSLVVKFLLMASLFLLSLTGLVKFYYHLPGLSVKTRAELAELLPSSWGDSGKLRQLETVRGVFRVFSEYKATHPWATWLFLCSCYLLYQAFPFFTFTLPGTATMVTLLLGALYPAHVAFITANALAAIGPSAAYFMIWFIGKPIVTFLFADKLEKLHRILRTSHNSQDEQQQSTSIDKNSNREKSGMSCSCKNSSNSNSSSGKRNNSDTKMDNRSGSSTSTSSSSKNDDNSSVVSNPMKEISAEGGERGCVSGDPMYDANEKEVRNSDIMNSSNSDDNNSSSRSDTHLTRRRLRRRTVNGREKMRGRGHSDVDDNSGSVSRSDSRSSGRRVQSNKSRISERSSGSRKENRHSGITSSISSSNSGSGSSSSSNSNNNSNSSTVRVKRSTLKTLNNISTLSENDENVPHTPSHMYALVQDEEMIKRKEVQHDRDNWGPVHKTEDAISVKKKHMINSSKEKKKERSFNRSYDDGGRVVVRMTPTAPAAAVAIAKNATEDDETKLLLRSDEEPECNSQSKKKKTTMHQHSAKNNEKQQHEFMCPHTISHAVEAKKKSRKQFDMDLFLTMLFLRVSPVFPNLVITAAAPLLEVPFDVFFYATLLGLMPNTAVFVSMGSALSSLDSLYGSWKLWGFLCVTGGAILVLKILRRRLVVYEQRAAAVEAKEGDKGGDH